MARKIIARLLLADTHHSEGTCTAILWPLTYPEVESWDWHNASRRCSSPFEPCSPPVRCRSAQLPPPHHSSCPGRYRLASSPLSQIDQSSAQGTCLWWGGSFKATVRLRLSFSLVEPSVFWLGSLRGFYRSSVAISDPCCHSAISVHWHPTPSAPCLIPGESWKPLWGEDNGNWLENPLIFKLYAHSPLY